MTLRAPERTTSTSPRCDKIVSGGGVLSYHCSLAQGHMEFSGPPEDREPCYSPDVPAARKAWSDWRERQEQREEEQEQQTVRCPSCGGRMNLGMQDGVVIGTCEVCGASAELQGPPSVEGALTAEEIEQEASQASDWKVLEGATKADHPAFVMEHLDAIEAGTMHNPYDPRCSQTERWLGPIELLSEVCVRCQIERRDEETETTEEQEDQIQLTFDDIEGGDVPVDVLVPTKQREGDQVLPKGGDRVVQDQIVKQEHERLFAAGTDAKDREEADRIGLDSQIVNAIMLESKRVGISRYGQPLHTFDGRKNIRDLADELRDALVYVTKLQMTAEADRETLVRMVTQRLEREYVANGLTSSVIPASEIAEMAVDTILDWVLAQRIGPDQVVPVREP